MAKKKKNIKKVDKQTKRKKNRKLTIRMTFQDEGNVSTKLKLEGGKLDPIDKFMLLLNLNELITSFKGNDEDIEQFLEEHKDE